MLLAAVVLFWVSYWLISKAEAERWQRYIQRQGAARARRGQRHRARCRGVPRGVPRRLRDGALLPRAVRRRACGRRDGRRRVRLSGSLVLGAVYAGFARLGLRDSDSAVLPRDRRLLYAMAIVFAGRACSSCRRWAWIGVTPVAGVPTIDVLGLHPTVETLAVQGVFLAALLYAMYRTLRRRGEPSDTAASPPAPRADVTPLRARDGRG